MTEALATAIHAMLAALLALLLMLLTLLVRAMQVIFILARPAALAGTVAASGWASVMLFMTVLVRYGNDLPAAMLALTAVVITPAALIVINPVGIAKSAGYADGDKADAGAWAVMLAVAVIDFLVHLGIERAPPVVVAALPAIGLAAVTFWHLRAASPPRGQPNEGENEMKSGASILVWIMTIALVIFSITCNYDILSQTLPQGQQIMGVFGLFALDFGLLCWLFWTTRASAPGKQRTLGALMVIVDLVGVAAGILGDMMLNFDPTTRETIGLVAVWVIGFVIVVNIAGAVATEITDPEQEGRDSERAYHYELTHQKAKALTALAPTSAANIAAAEAAHKAEQMMASFRNATQADPQIIQWLKQFSGNGHSKTATYQKDAPAPTLESDALAQAIAIVEAAGGKVTRPRKP